MAKISELEAEDKELADRDEQFKKDWEAEQRRTYPGIYREAGIRKQMIAAAVDESGRIPGDEPGHDPTLQEANLKDKGLLRDIAETAGMDNLPPHLTTNDTAATARPFIAAETGDADVTATAGEGEEKDGEEKKARRTPAKNADEEK